MIKKAFRLTENQIGKVLKYKKPFFSNLAIANVIRNSLEISRFALILSGKVAKTSVDRNFFRRKFYDIASKYLVSTGIDIAVVMKKWQICNRRDTTMVAQFEQDIDHLLRKILREIDTLPLVRSAPSSRNALKPKKTSPQL